MAGFSGGGSNGPDYVQPGEPVNPDPLETWYDTDADADNDGNAEGEYKIYGTDGSWHATSVDSHRELRDVLEDSHHTYPVPTTGIATDAVTTAKVATDAVTNALIAAGAVDTTQLAADAVTTSEVAADAVTNALIANGAVDTAQLAASAVTSSELATDAVTTDAVAADAVTATEVADNESLPVDISGNAATADVADVANDADKLDGVQPGNLQVAYADDAGTLQGNSPSDLTADQTQYPQTVASHTVSAPTDSTGSLKNNSGSATLSITPPDQFLNHWYPHGASADVQFMNYGDYSVTITGGRLVKYDGTTESLSFSGSGSGNTDGSWVTFASIADTFSEPQPGVVDVLIDMDYNSGDSGMEFRTRSPEVSGSATLNHRHNI